MAVKTFGELIKPGDSFGISDETRGPTTYRLNGELWAWKAGPGEPLQRFEGPSVMEWLKVTGQLYG